MEAMTLEDARIIFQNRTEWIRSGYPAADPYWGVWGNVALMPETDILIAAVRAIHRHLPVVQCGAFSFHGYVYAGYNEARWEAFLKAPR
jgi:hypothetical protein